MKKGTNEPTLSDVLERIDKGFNDLTDFFKSAGFKDAEPKHDFKVGDRVEGVGKVDGVDVNGKAGNVVVIGSCNPPICVEFDEASDDFHGGNPYYEGKDNSCYFCYPDNLRKITEPEWEDLTVTWTLNKEQAIEMWHRLDVILDSMSISDNYLRRPKNDNLLVDQFNEVDDYIEMLGLFKF